MKTLMILFAVTLFCCTPLSGASITMNEGNLFTAPAYTNSPFTLRLTDLESAPDIVEYAISLNITNMSGNPPTGDMAWDQFGTNVGTNNIFTGKDTSGFPFLVFVDNWTIDISYGLTYVADAITLLNVNDMLAEVSINGGNSLYDFKVSIDTDPQWSYILDSTGDYHDITGGSLLIIQPEPATMCILSLGILFIIRRKRDYSTV